MRIFATHWYREVYNRSYKVGKIRLRYPLYFNECIQNKQGYSNLKVLLSSVYTFKGIIYLKNILLRVIFKFFLKLSKIWQCKHRGLPLLPFSLLDHECMRLSSAKVLSLFFNAG